MRFFVCDDYSGRRSGQWLVLSIVFGLFVCALGLSDRIRNPLAVHDDLATSAYWIHKSIDPTLFPDDLMSQYSEARVAPFIKGFYRFGSLFADPITISRYLPFCITFILILMAFGIGRQITDDTGGFLFSLSLVLTSWYFGPGPGTSGETAILLNTAIVGALVGRSSLLAGFVLILSVVAYPPCALIAGLTFALFFLLPFKWNDKVWRFDFFIITSSGILAAVLMFWLYSSHQSLFGPIVTYKEALSMPEFGPFGRVPFFFSTLWDQLWSGTTGIELREPMIFLLGASFLFSLTNRQDILRKTPRGLWIFLLSGALLFAVAYLSLLKMLAPSKYLTQPLLIVLNVVVLVGLRSQKTHKKTILVTVAFFLAAVLTCGPYLFRRTADVPPARGTLESIAGLPPDAVVAGLPKHLNWVPILAKRSAFVCREAAEPYYPQFYREARRRLETMLKAYYAETPDEVLRFCTENHVTHFWVIRSDFKENWFAKENIYSEPIGSMILSWIGDRRVFILAQPPQEWIIDSDENSMLLTCTKP